MAAPNSRSTVSPCHHSGRPPHACAPHAGKMTPSRQVSWLAGRRPSSPSRALPHKAQWHIEEGLAAHSCGGSAGISPRLAWRLLPASLFMPRDELDTPEPGNPRTPPSSCQPRPHIFRQCVTLNAQQVVRWVRFRKPGFGRRCSKGRTIVSQKLRLG
jgi:hypothetical protein